MFEVSTINEVFGVYLQNESNADFAIGVPESSSPIKIRFVNYGSQTIATQSSLVQTLQNSVDNLLTKFSTLTSE